MKLLFKALLPQSTCSGAHAKLLNEVALSKKDVCLPVTTDSYPILAWTVDLLESPNGILHSQQHKLPAQDKAEELQVKLQKYGKQNNWELKKGSPDRKSETHKINLEDIF